MKKQRQTYIMRDQVRNQVGSIMAWRPHSAEEHRQPALGILAGRLLLRAADALFRGLSPTGHATRTAH